MTPKLTYDIFSSRSTSPDAASTKMSSRRRRYRRGTKSCDVLPVKAVTQDLQESITQKKLKLISNLKLKTDEIHAMRDLLDIEIHQNECLGQEVLDLVQSRCNEKELEKYNHFIEDANNITNLLLSLSGRLSLVENAIKMNVGMAKDQMKFLCQKRAKLLEQFNDAKDLKIFTDKQQQIVSEFLLRQFSRKQMSLFERYIKMKSSLIVEQRELDDKARLIEMQMQCLRDSIPESEQFRLQPILDKALL
ncbi:protein Shroom4-like [Clavelina lepadiformis]|uniref:ASD2 domain-containing protein n=1 Tax=Clavelina lepadiformis TaxID=159417 RepID=A0ABP0H3N2_CLALP